MLTLATRKRILVLLTFVVLSFTFFVNTNAVYANEEKKAKANDFKIGHLFLDFGGLNDIIEDSGFNYLRGIELCYRKILNKDYLNASIIYAWESNKGIGLHLYLALYSNGHNNSIKNLIPCGFTPCRFKKVL